MRIPLALVALLFACQPGPEGPQGPTGPAGPMGSPGTTTASADQNGSRIKLRVFATPDGMRRTIGYWDSTLNIECAFQLLDSVWRCLPIMTATVDVQYTDEACTQHVATLPPQDCGPVEVSYGKEPAAACHTPNFFKVELLSPQPVRLFAKQFDGRCAEIMKPSYLIYRIGDPVSASVFATGSIAVLP